MAVPKKRQSTTRRDKRRANHARMTPPNISLCPKCSEPKLSHQVCLSCGTYNGHEVIQIAEE
jgi:large subunit ribosomal protein L32